MRSLVVDDELVSRKKMKKILEKYGPCQAVESGSAALTAFTEAWNRWQPVDLVTLDVRMPGMGGDETLFRIRELEKTRGVADHHRVKLLMVSAQADKDTVVTCIQAGCDGYIMKPFDQWIIRDKLEAMGLPPESDQD